MVADAGVLSVRSHAQRPLSPCTRSAPLSALTPRALTPSVLTLVSQLTIYIEVRSRSTGREWRPRSCRCHCPPSPTPTPAPLQACESGSMFGPSTPLPNNTRIYATTASDADESSWGFCACVPCGRLSRFHRGSVLALVHGDDQCTGNHPLPSHQTAPPMTSCLESPSAAASGTCTP